MNISEKSTTNLTVNNLTEVIGAEITGIDLSKLNDTDVSYIKNLLLKKQVLVFRSQRLLPEELPSIINKFGNLYIHTNEKNIIIILLLG